MSANEVSGEAAMRVLLDRGPDPVEPGAVSEGALLDGLGVLAARQFASTADAIDAVLRAISEQTGVRSSFLTRITRDAGRSEAIAAFNAPGGCDVPAGVVLALPQTF